MNGSGERPQSNVYSIRDSKLFRDESVLRRTPPDDFAGVKELTESELNTMARNIVTLFPSIESLAKDIDRQSGGMGTTATVNNIGRAGIDYWRELHNAKTLQKSKLVDDVRMMFKGYNPFQTKILNTKYVAYARAYLEKFDPDYPLPNMK